MGKNYTTSVSIIRQPKNSQKALEVLTLLTFVLLVFFPKVGNTAVLTVGLSGSGPTYTRIQTAYNAAATGDTIRIMPAGASINGNGFLASGSNPLLMNIAKNIVIDGNGCTIFNASSSNIV